ncbi:hypothetical protein L3X38_022382 [Prunus dulcis]|uniref:Uncharacterized protein n=1 Tax=Prunus dulcis TaxID=3755 RepID=A0AAD4VW03_PRUDU|nr:hypothetical protein L3X38_022382 [Prunus dulcis]
MYNRIRYGPPSKKYYMSYPRLAAKGLALRMPWLSFDFIVEFLAILPFPQVAVAVLIFKVKDILKFYLYILASHMLGAICFYTLWWGFRNMSTYGTDLKTSNYLWENCFAILISAIGLLLFLYLIGNVKTCMQQLTSTNPLEVEKGKEGEIRCWMVRKLSA